jgi:NAD(P) transhydrogenase subunit alpha
MRIAVPKETAAGEARVALTPDLVPRLVKSGFQVVVASGAGQKSQATDEMFKTAGAEVQSGDVFKDADVVLSVLALTADQIKQLKPGCITISFLSPTNSVDSIKAAVAAKVTAISLELVPRISRAQSMDALTSQALCAGYKAALVGAELSPRFFPLLMTAAGTVTPANVLVLGAGVAGLQAIATSRRLGAVVSAYDVRPSSKDEVISMGASFIELELEALEGAGGYAREMTPERAAKQRELLTPYISKSDVLITTAAVPGRAAPRLVTSEMLQGMKSGSVIVDLAAESGGNVEGSKPGEIVETSSGIRIWGAKDVPSSLPFHASQLFAKNVFNLMMLMHSTDKPGEVIPNFEDEIIAASAVTHQGEIRLENVKSSIGGTA